MNPVMPVQITFLMSLRYKWCQTASRIFYPDLMFFFCCETEAGYFFFFALSNTLATVPEIDINFVNYSSLSFWQVTVLLSCPSFIHAIQIFLSCQYWHYIISSGYKCYFFIMEIPQKCLLAWLGCVIYCLRLILICITV